MKKALYYKTLADGRIKCLLCPHACLIGAGQVGLCGVRENKNGVLYSLVYAKATSIANDPIEKKPLYHFYPGSYILSFGSYGCNLRCGFCQNWQISQKEAPYKNIIPQQALELALQSDSLGIAYTYNEPFMSYEYVLETAKLLRTKGLKNVLVTNGEVNQEPLLEILPYIDAMNIDLKAFNEAFYHKYCGGKLSPVLDTIRLSYERCHIEITNLIIPGLNDHETEITQMVDWLADLRSDIPLHFSRYFPHYKFDQEPTPISRLLRARELAQKKLKYVYIGNIDSEEYNSTFCPGCKKALIVRDGYRILNNLIKNNCCPECGAEIPIVGS
jgi:pyruvate formate lyase activating enzyme